MKEDLALASRQAQGGYGIGLKALQDSGFLAGSVPTALHTAKEGPLPVSPELRDGNREAPGL